MTSNTAYGIVPVIGGAALIIGGTAALFIDRMDLLADPAEPRPVLLRYTSQATFALKKRPHWIFLVACCIFGPCLMVTAQWQSQLVEENVTDPDLEGQLVLYATGCALGGFGVALLPMGNVTGTILHVISASIFAAFGINYAFRSWTLSDALLGNGNLTSFRLAIALFGSVGGLVTAFSVYPGVAGTAALEGHKKTLLENPEATEGTEGVLTSRGIWMARLGETTLAIGQISIALTMALALLSATGEVGDVRDSSSWTWITGVVSGIGMFALAFVFYLTNERWFLMCQHGKEVNENTDAEVGGEIQD